KFEMEDKTTLSVNVGGADPGCAGYVTIENAKKHFNLTELVTLTAHPSPGYAFNGWDGHFVDIQGRRPGQIGKTEPQITLMMSEDWNVVAVFREAIVDAKTLKFIWDPNRPGGPGYTPLAVDELNVAVGDQAYALAQDYQSNGAIYAWDHNHWINTDATDADCDGV